MNTLLAVDLGLTCGFACMSDVPQILWARSKHYASRGSMRRAAAALIREQTELQHLVLEGDRQLGIIWEKPALQQGVDVIWVSPETWRQRMYGKMKLTGSERLKEMAVKQAMHAVKTLGISMPKQSLRHDAAEAVLIALWAVESIGWFKMDSF